MVVKDFGKHQFLGLSFTDKEVEEVKDFDEGSLHEDFEEAKIKVFHEPEKEILKKYNDSGFNIYKSINKFSSNKVRKSGEVTEFKGIGIDLDKKVENIVSYVFKKVGFYPTMVVETYKGYHIYFQFSMRARDVTYMEERCYRSLYSRINGALKGDPHMNSVTGILKEPGYWDNKKGRSNYKIKRIYKRTQRIGKDKIERTLANLPLLKEYVNGPYSKEELEEIKKVKVDLRRKKRAQEKYEAVTKRTGVVNTYDSKELIENLEDFFKVKILESDGRGIRGASGLKLYTYRGKTKIKDFTNKGRHENYSFLFRFFLKKYGISMADIGKFLKRTYGVSLNGSYSKKDFFIDYSCWRLLKEIEDTRTGLWKEIGSSKRICCNIKGVKMTQKEKKEYLDLFCRDLSYRAWTFRILKGISYQYYIKKKQAFKVKELLEDTGLSDSRENKKRTRSVLSFLNLTGRIKIKKGLTYGTYLLKMQDTKRLIPGDIKNAKSFLLNPKAYFLLEELEIKLAYGPQVIPKETIYEILEQDGKGGNTRVRLNQVIDTLKEDGILRSCIIEREKIYFNYIKRKKG